MKALELIEKVNFNHEKKTLEITLNRPKIGHYSDINMKRKDIRKVVKARTKELIAHFKEGGWDLNASCIREYVISEVLGFDLQAVIDAEVMSSADCTISYGEGRVMYKKNGGYFPVFYDTYTGEIIILDEPETKGYIFEYSEKNGFVSLGCL